MRASGCQLPGESGAFHRLVHISRLLQASASNSSEGDSLAMRPSFALRMHPFQPFDYLRHSIAEGRDTGRQQYLQDPSSPPEMQPRSVRAPDLVLTICGLAAP